jgi:hypothetical protein
MIAFFLRHIEQLHRIASVIGSLSKVNETLPQWHLPSYTLVASVICQLSSVIE